MKKLIILFFMMFSFAAFTAPTGQDVVTRTNELITAIEANDYDSFIKDGSADFKKITKVDFESVSKSLSSKMKSGKEVTFATTYVKAGQKIHLFKISFADKSDDVIAKIVMGDKGETLGFWIQ